MYKLFLSRFITSMAICILFISGLSAGAEDVQPAKADVPAEWASTYTPEELGAIDRALWAANFTREDLKFRKDYTKGYDCFPIVREMMADPLSIAPDMDKMVAGIETWRKNIASPFAEIAQALAYYPGIDQGKINDMMAYPDVALSSYTPTENPEGLIETLKAMASAQINLPWSTEEVEMMRDFIPLAMSWHDVFESPYDKDRHDAWKKMMEEQPEDYLYKFMTKTPIDYLAGQYMSLCPDPRNWLMELPGESFPTEKKIIDTEWGKIGIGTIGDDEWEGDFVILIDPGGDDHYHNCRIGAAYGTEGHRFGYFADLGGNDFYDCGDVNINLGAAVLGVAAFYDLGQGNDRYVSGNATLGAAMCGIATFYDDGGSDTYEGKVFSQGSAGYGIGIMVDDSVQAAPEVPTDVDTPEPIEIALFDNDFYHAWANSQAFARTLGFALCSNRRGNEIYEAGGVYLDAPLFSDRYQSFSQGFAIGERGIDYAGGIALILDYSGNDRYLGDIYNQGVGYWYSAGFQYDCAGNDTYEMTQYGQGSGIHLAIGGLIDVSGNDSYTMHSGLGTGGSHDYAASVLHDRAGNDQYFGNTSCNGGSLTDSAVIFIDRAGDDTYAGRREGGINFGRPERGFPSIGVLIDLSGKDDYLGVMDNGKLWNQTDIGVGWDVIPPPPPEGAKQPVAGLPDQPGANVKLPEIISYEGEFTEDVFNKLWEISVRWEVGDNRYIVPKARERLIAFGPVILPYVSKEMNNDQSGLGLRAMTVIFQALIKDDHDGVINVLRENLTSSEEMRRRVALAEISDLKTAELGDDIAAMLDDPDPSMQRRAIATLGAISSHVADKRLMANLEKVDDEALVKVSLEVLCNLDVYSYDDLRPLLDHPMVSVRETLVGKFVAKTKLYAADLKRDLLISVPPTYSVSPRPLSTRALRSVLRVFYIAELTPDESLMSAISDLLGNSDWGVRADALRVVRHWEAMSKATLAESEANYPGLKYPDLADAVKPLVDQVSTLLTTETDPYVLFVGSNTTYK